MSTVKKVVEGSTEDEIFAQKAFINELQKVCDERFEKLWAVVREDALKNISFEETGISEGDLNDYLFDYIYNNNEELMFEEYLDKYSHLHFE